MYINPKITVVNNSKEKESFFCEICGFSLLTHKDFSCYRKYSSCEECFITLIEPIKTQWTGDKKLINKNKLKEYIYLRKRLSTKKENLEE